MSSGAGAALRSFLARCDHVTRAGDQWIVRCPSHKDDKASLAVKEGREGRVLLNCHAGCSKDDILRTMNLSDADLFDEPPTKSAGLGREDAVYPYHGRHGALVYQ